METPKLYQLLSDCERLSISVHEEAGIELANLHAHIKALKEQQERTDKVLADSVHGIKQTVAWNKRLDELQQEIAILKIQLAEAKGERDTLY